VDYHQIGRRGAGRSGQTRLGAAALGGALLITALPAGATELAGAPLSVDRSPSAYDCPDAPTLAQMSVALGSPPAPPSAPLRLGVHFQRGPEGYVALIEAAGRKQGTRELQSSATTCASLAESVSVVLAVLTDLIPPPDNVPALSPAAARAIEPAPAPEPSPPPPLTLAVGPDFGIAYGLVGKAATATATAALRVRYRTAELELGALWSTPHFETVAPGIVSLSLLAGTALGCWWFAGDRTRTVGACAGLGVGSLHGGGHGYDHDGEAATLWLAALGGLVAELRIRPHWACRFALSAVLPLGEDTFAVAPNGQGIGTSPAAIWARFGPEYRFW
jgi:hypothetical protein